MPVSDDELLALETPIYSIDAKFRITSRGRVSGVKVLRWSRRTGEQKAGSARHANAAVQTRSLRYQS